MKQNLMLTFQILIIRVSRLKTHFVKANYSKKNLKKAENLKKKKCKFCCLRIYNRMNRIYVLLLYR